MQMSSNIWVQGLSIGVYGVKMNFSQTSLSIYHMVLVCNTNFQLLWDNHIIFKSICDITIAY